MSSHPSEPADPPGEAAARTEPIPAHSPGPFPSAPAPAQPVPSLEPPPPAQQAREHPGGDLLSAAGPDAAAEGPPPPPSVVRELGSPWDGVLGTLAWVLICLAAWALLTVVAGTIVVAAAAAAGLTTLETDKVPPGILIAATVAGNLVFLAVPLAFAAITAPPRLWHFGLRRTRFWPTLGWAVLALFGWFVFSTIYQAVVDPAGKQSTADDLGVNRSTTLLVVGGFVVIVLAPIFEEFFFRGFIYRTLRNGLAGKLGLGAGVALAAVLDGLLFGVIHGTNTPIAILPVLAVLGAAFCLVYERTGSLFAVIALHATVNTLGYLGAAKNSAPVALGFGGAMILACIVVPRLIGRGPPRAEAPATA